MWRGKGDEADRDYHGRTEGRGTWKDCERNGEQRELVEKAVQVKILTEICFSRLKKRDGLEDMELH